MKKFISTLAGILCAVSFSSAQDIVIFTANTVQTNSPPLVTTNAPDNDVYLNGWVDTLIVELNAVNGGSPTGTVTITTLRSQSTGAARTVFAKSGNIAGVYPLRDIVTGQTGSDISNVPARVPLFMDKLRATLTNWGTNAADTVTLRIILSPLP